MPNRDVITGRGKRDVYVDTDNSFYADSGVLRLSGNLLITPLGGIARQYIWNGGGTTVKGTIVHMHTNSNTVEITGVNDIDACGIIYESGIASGSLVYVVFTGVAEVLLKDGVAGVTGANGWMGTHDVAGRARCQANPGAVGLHNQEIGHCLLNIPAGVDVLTRCHLHFN